MRRFPEVHLSRALLCAPNGRRACVHAPLGEDGLGVTRTACPLLGPGSSYRARRKCGEGCCVSALEARRRLWRRSNISRRTCSRPAACGDSRALCRRHIVAGGDVCRGLTGVIIALIVEARNRATGHLERRREAREISLRPAPARSTPVYRVVEALIFK